MKQIETTEDLDRAKYWDYVTRKHRSDAYAICSDLQRLDKLLKTPLHPSQFIPMDEEGNILEEPKPCPVNCDQGDYHEKGKCGRNGCVQQMREWNKAQEKILFLGDWKKAYGCFIKSYEFGSISLEEIKTIQDLIPLKIPVTEALRQKLK